MANPDYIKIIQWIKQINFYCQRIEEQLKEKVKEQQDDLHRYSETGKEYKKNKQQTGG